MLEGPHIQCPPSHHGLPLQSCFIRACCDGSGAAFRPSNLILCPVRQTASAFEPCLCSFACLISRIPWPVLIVDPCKTKAVIINEENAFGNNSRRFSYSYRFYQDGHAYTGNSLDSKYQVGDSVWVKYVPSFPRFHRILGPEE